jgi:hypothetical protein
MNYFHSSSGILPFNVTTNSSFFTDMMSNINYFKGQTMSNPNTKNKTNLHNGVVENVDSVIYLIEKE